MAQVVLPVGLGCLEGCCASLDPISPLLPAGTQRSCHKAINTSHVYLFWHFHRSLQVQHGTGQPGFVVFLSWFSIYMDGVDFIL